MKIIDLTHTFTDNMPVYPGDPAQSLQQVAHLDKEGYNDHLLHTTGHVGTHMDAPLHMISGGKKMDEIDPDTFIGKGVLIDARGKKKVDETLLKNVQIEKGSIILVYTGFGSKYRAEKYYENYPPITEGFAKKMVEAGVKVVGMDMLGPDQPPYSTHKILLGREILIVENLTNLHKLLKIRDFEVIALPAKLHADAAPVRVIARIQEKQSS